MKPTNAILLMALIINACSPLHNMQKVESQIPSIGSIGAYRSGLFKKDFQKVGEPVLDTPISVSIQSMGFTPSIKAKYAKYLEVQAEEPMVEFQDSTAVPRYYQMQITDIVGITTQLNNEANTTVRQYIQDDQGLQLLTTVSFMVDKQTEGKLQATDQYYLHSQNGALVLKIGSGSGAEEIKMTSLQTFDFETSGFCWKRNKRGHVEIAHILMDGKSCPGETESNPNKLGPILDYSKL